ncbi:MAG: putative nicotinate phosphoribosyltransferase [Candidatus Methanofastidiosum methylothiophilum]|uniref:nicotinate phosphoribosyltransferase n=1 Tax=Candidatus Methanofastidiosum methylothiophilum TaxID=1705564 RepID=A0A150JAH9_9EURY|nr:MAG: putative nicotinate phosphoribosyltransferase [Candidatus Methanofastidiosum methylthiophilus]
MFFTASEEDIKSGKTTDFYFINTKKILDEKNINKKVVVEITASGLPNNYRWGIMSGLYEALKLLEGYNVDVMGLDEGSLFYPQEPVLTIEGNYREFCHLETALLGFLCQSSGISTKSARLKKLAGEKPVLSFGVRRMHPTIAPMIDRAAYVGGLDGFSCIGAENVIGKKASGTMPHSLALILGDSREAFILFDDIIDKSVPRIVLVDTFCDEKREALIAAESIKNLTGVRLDTPGSRRGNMSKIIQEVRWELDIRGYKNVKIFISGGLDEDSFKNLNGADAFGVGTSVSNAKTIDFALDIVEIEGVPFTKRGKFSGKKTVLRCPKCLSGKIAYGTTHEKCTCGEKFKPIQKQLMKNGKILLDFEEASKTRDKVLDQIKIVEL